MWVPYPLRACAPKRNIPRMLLMGMWMSLMKKPIKPMIAKPTSVAMAIFFISADDMAR